MLYQGPVLDQSRHRQRHPRSARSFLSVLFLFDVPGALGWYVLPDAPASLADAAVEARLPSTWPLQLSPCRRGLPTRIDGLAQGGSRQPSLEDRLDVLLA